VRRDRRLNPVLPEKPRWQVEPEAYETDFPI